MRIDGAIFDLDGTLLDSMFIWDTIGEVYLKSRGVDPRENLNEKFKTMSLAQAAEYYRSEYGLTDSVQEIMDGVNSMIGHFYRDVVQPKAGSAEFLAELSARGVRMCVATATDRDLVEAALRRCGIAEYFSGIFTCTEVGSGKDCPAIFETALRQMGTPKASTVVFEDALYAVRTAKNAGFCVVGVYDASESPHEPEIIKTADIYIRSFAEMSENID